MFLWKAHKSTWVCIMSQLRFCFSAKSDNLLDCCALYGGKVQNIAWNHKDKCYLKYSEPYEDLIFIPSILIQFCFLIFSAIVFMWNGRKLWNCTGREYVYILRDMKYHRSVNAVRKHPLWQICQINHAQMDIDCSLL